VSSRGLDGEERSARDLAIANRERIRTLEGEVEKLRLRQHEIGAEVAAFGYVGKKLGELAIQIHELASRVEQMSRRAMGRPTSGGVNAAAAWVSVLVAAAALVIVALR